MHRRDMLTAAIGVVGITSVSGCLGDQTADPSDGTTPDLTPTEDPTSTPTETPVEFPETCEQLPDIDGLPTPPSELSEETVGTFVEDFERIYAVATNDEYGGVESLQMRSVEKVDERYVINLTFDAVPMTATPDSDGTTPTALPPDAYTHHATYRVTETRMLRELRSHIDNSLLAKTCWTFDGE